MLRYVWFPVSVLYNFVRKNFSDIRLQNAVTLKTGLMVRESH